MPIRKKIIIAVIVSVTLVLPLFKVNFEIGERILRINYDKPTNFETIKKHMMPIKQPLVLKEFCPYCVGKEKNKRVPYGVKFLRSIGLSEEIILSLPDNHPKLIDMDWIIRANPYPSLVEQVYPESYKTIFGFMFGYIDYKNNYNQICWYGGETSVLPSPLCRKKTIGDEGDYFVVYALILKKENIPGKNDRWQFIKYVDWSALMCGSYDGLKAIAFSVIATPIEIVLFNIILFIIFLKKKKNSKTVA